MRHVPQRFQAYCAFCDDPLDIRAEGVYSLQTGWVKNRSAGGGNALALREMGGQYACPFCIEKHTAGAAKWQPSLFG